MKPKVPTLMVKPESPFKDDALERQSLCNTLTNEYIHKEISPYVLAIDAAWGNGKTVFLQMWKAYLDAQGTRCVLYDAWESDFYGDALATMIGEISAQFSESQPEEFKDAAGRLIKAMPLAGFKAAAGAVGLGAVADAAANSVKQHDAIEDYLKYRKARDDFKNNLKSFAESEDTPLVFFIDELDRCRPDFALEVLEKTKHIFDVESVIFVIALNKKALAKTIEKTYGIENGEVYLRRFFDDVHNLKNERAIVEPMIDNGEFSNHIVEYKQDYQKFFGDMSSVLDLSLRDQKQIFPGISEALSDTRYLHQFRNIISYFFSLKSANPMLYETILASADNIDDFPFDQVLASLDVSVSRRDSIDVYTADALFACFGALRRAFYETQQDYIHQFLKKQSAQKRKLIERLLESSSFSYGVSNKKDFLAAAIAKIRQSP